MTSAMAEKCMSKLIREEASTGIILNQFDEFFFGEDEKSESYLLFSSIEEAKIYIENNKKRVFIISCSPQLIKSSILMNIFDHKID